MAADAEARRGQFIGPRDVTRWKPGGTTGIAVTGKPPEDISHRGRKIDVHTGVLKKRVLTDAHAHRCACRAPRFQALSRAFSVDGMLNVDSADCSSARETGFLRT